MAEHNELGKIGEQIAKAFLIEAGYKILATNWRSGRHELDIVARIDNEIVFVEVKTRVNDYFGLPESFVGPKKQRKTGLAAEAYLSDFPSSLEPRYDVIAVLHNSERTEVEHFKDFFFPRLC